MRTLGRSSYHPVNIWFEPVLWPSAPLWLGDRLLGSEDVKLLTWQMPLYYLRPRKGCWQLGTAGVNKF